MLNERRKLFIKEYIIDFNAARAARSAGYSEKDSWREGYRLLKVPDIQEAIAKEFNKRLDKLDVDIDKIVTGLAKVAFSDIKDYVTFGPNGVFIKDCEGLDCAAVCEVQETKDSKKIRLYDKIKALEILAKYKGMLIDTNKIVLPPEYTIVKDLLSKYSNMSIDELKGLRAKNE